MFFIEEISFFETLSDKNEESVFLFACYLLVAPELAAASLSFHDRIDY